MIPSEVTMSSRGVTKSVTNCPHKMAFFIGCNQVCNQTEGTLGHSGAIESKISGYRGQAGATQGNRTIGLITQRSQVQILPPQPTHSIGLKLVFSAPETVTNFWEMSLNY